MDYNENFIKQFDEITSFTTSIKTILPKVLVAGKVGGRLTKEGSILLDESEDLLNGIILCPPEGDAGTGMVSTN
jgi:hypothetical protein